MRAKILRALLVASMFLAPVCHAEATYLSGRISNVTAGAGGLLIALDTGVPTNCDGAAYGWMIIPEANKTMIALALMVWQNGGGAVVYTSGLSGGQCTITQFDPWES